MDWDKLKVFHAAAQAGSFTHAGEQLGLSQSAVSRQVSALEQELGVSLFHRHARGLLLTEQGELLHPTAHDAFMKLEAVRAKLTDSRERPNGDLRVTTTPGIGVHWLTPRLGEFVELYPDINLTLITTDEDLDLAMREADVAIRLRQPTQPDLIQRKLFSVRFHAYASPEYIKRFGTPRALDDLDNHRVLLLGGRTVPQYLENPRWLIGVARNGKGPRTPALTINNVLGVLRACQRGIGVALLPDYLVEENGGLVQLFGESDTIALDAYFVYPEELKSVARVQVFRVSWSRKRSVGIFEQPRRDSSQLFGAAPILHRADHYDLENEPEDQQHDVCHDRLSCWNRVLGMECLKIKRLGHSIRPHATTLNGQVGLQAIPTTQHPLGTKTPEAANTAGFTGRLDYGAELRGLWGKPRGVHRCESRTHAGGE